MSSMAWVMAVIVTRKLSATDSAGTMMLYSAAIGLQRYPTILGSTTAACRAVALMLLTTWVLDHKAFELEHLWIQ